VQERPSPPRPIGIIVVSALLLLLCLNAWTQVARDLFGVDRAPELLTILQACSGALALVTAAGAWNRRVWAPGTAILFGLVTGGMVLGLGPMLDMSEEQRKGIWVGALGLVAVSVAIAWYLRRMLRSAA
jgi:hypothetical protein